MTDTTTEDESAKQDQRFHFLAPYTGESQRTIYNPDGDVCDDGGPQDMRHPEKTMPMWHERFHYNPALKKNMKIPDRKPSAAIHLLSPPSNTFLDKMPAKGKEKQ